MKLLLLTVVAATSAWAQREVSRHVEVRGKALEVMCYAGAKDSANILYLPGDGGWSGFAITMARSMAGWGYRLCALDTEKYLEAFTGKTATLTEKQVAGDLTQIARSVGGGQRTILAGWSAGAAFAAVAAADTPDRSVIAGAVLIGLPERGILGWRLGDAITWITGREPDEPSFATTPYLSRISPTPVAMIHASGDQYTAAQKARQMFEQARQPSRFTLVTARNHRFDGNTDGFFRALKEALAWIESNR